MKHFPENLEKRRKAPHPTKIRDSKYAIRRLILKYLCAILGILALLWACIFNEFPLVTSDTGAYINTAFDLLVPGDRTIFYGLIVRLFSLKLTLWGVIAAQAVLLYFVMDNFISSLFNLKKYFVKLLLIATSALFTSLPWFVSQIMPDIFTPVVFLSALLFLITDNKRKSVVFLLILLGAIILHNSHLLTSVLFFFLLAFLSFFIQYLRTKRKKTLILLATSIFGWFVVLATNLFAGHGFTVNKSSHVFFMSKLVENGILKSYLKDHCAETHYKLCDYKDKLPVYSWDFMWDPNGALAKTDGWVDYDGEYKAIINGTFTEPKYLKMHVIESTKATLQQIRFTHVGDGLRQHINGENPSEQVKKYFPQEFSSYLTSRQNRNELAFDPFNKLYHYYFLLSFLALPLLFLRKLNAEIRIAYLLTLIFVLINAFVTATFASVVSRFNARDIWLLPLFHISFIVWFLNTWFNPKSALENADSIKNL